MNTTPPRDDAPRPGDAPGADDRSGGFEQAMDRLEAIVEELEAGSLSLEESIARYEEGMALSRRLTRTLDEAEKRIERLVESDRDGAPPTTRPMEAPRDSGPPAARPAEAPRDSSPAVRPTESPRDHEAAEPPRSAPAASEPARDRMRPAPAPAEHEGKLPF